MFYNLDSCLILAVFHVCVSSYYVQVICVNSEAS